MIIPIALLTNQRLRKLRSLAQSQSPEGRIQTQAWTVPKPLLFALILGYFKETLDHLAECSFWLVWGHRAWMHMAGDKGRKC